MSAKLSTGRSVPACVSARLAPRSARIESAKRLAETLAHAGLDVGAFYIGEPGMNVIPCFHSLILVGADRACARRTPGICSGGDLLLRTIAIRGRRRKTRFEMHVMPQHRAILEVLHPSHVPGHSMYGDWALPGRKYSYIALGDLVARHLPGKVPTCVQFAHICAKPGDWFGSNDFSGPRFANADPRYPGFVVRGMPNPCQLPFRLIDGRRRLEKLRRAGAMAADFYVFEYSEVEPYVFDFAVKGGN